MYTFIHPPYVTQNICLLTDMQSTKHQRYILLLHDMLFYLPSASAKITFDKRCFLLWSNIPLHQGRGISSINIYFFIKHMGLLASTYTSSSIAWCFWYQYIFFHQAHGTTGINIYLFINRIVLLVSTYTSS